MAADVRRNQLVVAKLLPAAKHLPVAVAIAAATADVEALAIFVAACCENCSHARAAAVIADATLDADVPNQLADAKLLLVADAKLLLLPLHADAQRLLLRWLLQCHLPHRLLTQVLRSQSVVSFRPVSLPPASNSTRVSEI